MRRKGSMEAPTLEQARQRLLLGSYEIESLVEEGRGSVEGEARSLTAATNADDPRVRILAAVFVGLAALTLLAQWKLRPPPPPQLQSLSLEVTGSLQEGTAIPESAVLLVDLPQMPLRLELPWKEVVQGAEQFRVQLDVKTSRRPDYGWVRLCGPGPRTAMALEDDQPEREDFRKLRFDENGRAKAAPLRLSRPPSPRR